MWKFVLLVCLYIANYMSCDILFAATGIDDIHNHRWNSQH